MSFSHSPDESVPRDRWVASLSNGEVVYEDTRKDSPTWERLSRYCKENDLSIVRFSLQIAGTEVKLPINQQGYIQKKIAWCNPTYGGIKQCIGYVQDGQSLIYEVDSNRDSYVRRGDPDPGEPWVIYRKDIREKKAENV